MSADNKEKLALHISLIGIILTFNIVNDEKKKLFLKI